MPSRERLLRFGRGQSHFRWRGNRDSPQVVFPGSYLGRCLTRGRLLVEQEAEDLYRVERPGGIANVVPLDALVPDGERVAEVLLL